MSQDYKFWLIMSPHLISQHYQSVCVSHIVWPSSHWMFVPTCSRRTRRTRWRWWTSWIWWTRWTLWTWWTRWTWWSWLTCWSLSTPKNFVDRNFVHQFFFEPTNFNCNKLFYLNFLWNIWTMLETKPKQGVEGPYPHCRSYNLGV